MLSRRALSVEAVHAIAKRPAHILLWLRSLLTEERATQSEDGRLLFEHEFLEKLERGVIKLPKDLVEAYSVVWRASPMMRWILEADGAMRSAVQRRRVGERAADRSATAAQAA